MKKQPTPNPVPKIVITATTDSRITLKDQFDDCDVSFISLRLILPPLLNCLHDGGEVVALIKPQFEAGRAEIGKNGVVRDAAVHERVIREMLTFADTIGFTVCGLSFSPITGPKGNVEFLLYMRKECTKNDAGMHKIAESVPEIVKNAHLLGKSC